MPNTRQRLSQPDTAAYVVTRHDDGSTAHRGDMNAAISPNGQWVVFVRRTIPQGPRHLFKIPINGDATQRVQLTFAATGADHHPMWSNDGKYIIYQRTPGGTTPYSIMRIRADGTGTPQEFYTEALGKPSNYNATTPAYSPDGKIVLAGIGPYGVSDSVATHTLDTLLSVKKPIKNYPDAAYARGGTFPTLSPRLSNDGTRLGMNSQVLWAVRRNMNLPPRITSVGSATVHDTTAWVTFIYILPSQPGPIDFVVTDPENDAIKCKMALLEPWMAFDTTLCRLTMNPGQNDVGTFHTKFYATTPSGGTEAIIVTVTVSEPSLSPLRTGDSEAITNPVSLPDGPNPTRGEFRLTAPIVSAADAILRIFDLSGRQLALIRGRSGSQLVWNGQNSSGAALVHPGVYLYQLQLGRYRQDGKIVVVR